MRYLLHLAYKGTSFRGWQRQPDVTSVQQVIEDRMSKYLKEKVVLVGCGRTDAGVHASNYVAHIDVSALLPEQFLFIMSKLLPADIVIYSTELVGDNAQAQFHVSRRQYDYFIHTLPDPALADISTFMDSPQTADMEVFSTALSMLIGERDFRGFCKQPDMHDSTICIMKEATVYKNDYRIQVRVVANRFLRSMVRLIVGNAYALACGDITMDDWVAILEDKYENAFEYRARPEGLYLSGVYYRDRTFDRRSFMDLS